MKKRKKIEEIKPGTVILCRHHDLPGYNQWLVAVAVTKPMNESPEWFDAKLLGSQEIVSLRGTECQILGSDEHLKNNCFEVEVSDAVYVCRSDDQPYNKIPKEDVSDIQDIRMISSF